VASVIWLALSSAVIGIVAYLHYVLNKKARPLLHLIYPDLVELYPADGSEHSSEERKIMCKELAKLSLLRRYWNMWDLTDVTRHVIQHLTPRFLG